jgi:hypothetical protein
MTSRSLLALALATPFAVLLSIGGCGLQTVSLYTCRNPDKGHKDANGEPDPCHEHDGECGGDPGGTCVPLQPLNWSAPALLWFGSSFDAPPPCPASAPILAYVGHSDLTSSFECPVCACDAPTGSCALPSTLAARQPCDP